MKQICHNDCTEYNNVVISTTLQKCDIFYQKSMKKCEKSIVFLKNNTFYRNKVYICTINEKKNAF